MPYTVTVQPAIEPISLGEAKAHCRIDHSAEDSLIEGYITAARMMVEAQLNRALITQTRSTYFDHFRHEYELPGAPLQSLVSFTIHDQDGAANAYTVSNFILDEVEGEIYQKPLSIYPMYWLREANPIQVVYTCGYGSAASDVPAPIRQAIKMLVAHLLNNRQAVELSRTTGWPQQVEFGVTALLEPYRLISI